MVINTALKASVVSAVGRQSQLPTFSAEVLKLLVDAAEEFELSPDEFIDVIRLPSSVVTLPALIDHLRSTKVKLEERDSKVKNEDWDVAKAGLLRQYKLFACSLKALTVYLADSPVYNVPISVFTAEVIKHAVANKPATLAKNGKILWEKTFEDGTPRTVAVMRTIIYLCLKETNSPTSAAPPPPPPAATVVPVAPVVSQASKGAKVQAKKSGVV